MARNIPLVTLLGTLALLGISGCKGGPSTTGPIPVGEYASMTGDTATFGQSSHKGTAMAIDEINSAGGVNGRPIQLFTEDDQSKAPEAATAVQKLLDRNHAIAVL